MKKKKGKKRIIIAIIIAVIALICLTMCDMDVATDEGTAQATTAMENTVQTVVDAHERNTSDMVDSIARQAREDAKKAGANELAAAQNFIAENYTNCFKDNETMERMMYCGWLLEYTYEGNDVEYTSYCLGQDAEQLGKCVYRGVETPEEDRTQANIRQIQKSLSKLGK